MRRVALLLVVVLCAGACGGGANNASAKPTAAETAFCQKILPLVWKGDQAGFDAATKNPPAGFDPKNDKSSVGWIESHCYPDIAPDAAPVNQRIAAPAGSKLDGLTACLALSSPPQTDRSAHVAIYGHTSDPYATDAIAIISGGEGHIGDGTPKPIAVRGTVGSYAPITVFQKVVLKRLGTVIAWSENNVAYGLYGRLWYEDKVESLAALADKLEMVDGALELPKAALPSGYRELYKGSVLNLPLIAAYLGIYQVQYRDGTGIVTVTGSEMTPAEFEATRFFTLDVFHQKLGDHDALVGQPWDNDGYALVQWRDKSGVVVRFFGTNETVARVTKLAKKAKSLTAKQWGELAQIPAVCDSYN